MDTEFFEVAPGQWAYRVGSVYQEFDPDLPGEVPMSRETAEFYAAVVAARLAA